MIMHGDGHGGIHWHDGLVDINGIFDGRFPYVITNPPFGASVTKTQLIGATTISDVPNDATYEKSQKERYGAAWKASHDAVVGARGTPILDMFEIGRDKNSRQTETLFVERCLRLVQPGGMVAIVLPSGNLNAASLSWLRRWVEGKAFLRAVIALPIETFKFSKASVSASVVILQRFTEQDEQRWEACWTAAEDATRPTFDEQRDALLNHYEHAIITAKDDPELVRCLSDLAEYSVERVLPEYECMPPEGFERGAGSTRIGSPIWDEVAGPRKAELISLKRAYNARARECAATIAEELSKLRAALREVDQQQTAALGAEVRAKFDYPVFMARPAAVGITASGDTGPHVPNDLPEILESWKRFRKWLDDGMPEGREI